MEGDFDAGITLAGPDDELAGLLQAGPFETGDVPEAQAGVTTEERSTVPEDAFAQSSFELDLPLR